MDVWKFFISSSSAGSLWCVRNNIMYALLWWTVCANPLLRAKMIHHSCPYIVFLCHCLTIYLSISLHDYTHTLYIHTYTSVLQRELWNYFTPNPPCHLEVGHLWLSWCRSAQHLCIHWFEKNLGCSNLRTNGLCFIRKAVSLATGVVQSKVIEKPDQTKKNQAMVYPLEGVLSTSIEYMVV